MAVEHWVGVFTDIVNIVSFVSKFLGSAQPGSSPEDSQIFTIGNVQFYASSQGGQQTITAQNNNNFTVTLLATEPESDAGINTATKTIGATGTIDFGQWIQDEHLGNGSLSIINTPAPSDESFQTGTFLKTFITTYARMPLSKFAIVTGGMGLTANYDSTSKSFYVGWDLAGNIVRVISSIRSVSGITTTQDVKPPTRSSAGSSDSTTSVTIPVPDTIVADDEFAELQLIVDIATE